MHTSKSSPGRLPAEVSLPLFAYLTRDEAGAVFLQVNDVLFMPLFTSLGNARHFATQAKIDYPPIEMPTAADVLLFVKNPRSCEWIGDVAFRIMFDPIEPDVGDYVVCDRDALIDSLAESRN
jgi:hypothetical protein